MNGRLSFRLPTRFIKKFKDQTTVRITVKKDQVSFNCALTFQENAGTQFAVLSSGRYMGRYLNDLGYLDIELNLNAATGYKIPSSSIIKKKMTVIPKEYVTNGSQKIERRQMFRVSVKVTWTDKSGKEIKTFVSLENASVKDDKYYVNDTILAPGDTIVDSVQPQIRLH